MDTPKHLTDSDVPQFRADALNVLVIQNNIQRGICSDQRRSIDDYYDNGLFQIISSNVINNTIANELEANAGIDTISWNLTYTDVTLHRPSITKAKDIINVVPLMPIEAYTRGLTYSGALHVHIIGTLTAHYINGETKSIAVSVRRHIGNIPIAVGSKYCNTRGMSVENLLRQGEDPTAYGGEVIVKGGAYNIDNTENTPHNMARIYINEGHKNEICYMSIISKPGDGFENSAQIFIKFLTGGQIVIVIDRDPLSSIQIPFYLIFRLFGWARDDYLINWLMTDEDPEINQYILVAINMAFRYQFKSYPNAVSVYDPVKIIQMIAAKSKSFERMVNSKDPNALKNLTERFMASMDKYLLPHIGLGPEFRDEKLRALCHYISDVFYVKMGISPETDRDSAAQKRIHAIGPAMSKTTKTRWNLTVNKPISSSIEHDLKKTPFDKITSAHVNRIIANVSLKELEKGLTQPITQGNKTELVVGKSLITNRMSSQNMGRNSRLAEYSTKQQISNPGDKTQKQSSRAHAMRAVHAMNEGILCPCQTQEGEPVGLNKQIPIGAHITMASSSAILKEKLSECKMITPRNDITPEQLRDGYTRVMVNGYIIGYTQLPQNVIDMYRHKRRTGSIDKYTTMFMDPITHIVNFFVDLGRIVQILIIVYNNRGDTRTQPNKEQKSKKFAQWTMITMEHIHRLRQGDPDVIEEMFRQGVIEYISAGEQQTLLVAPSHDKLWDLRFDELHQYTHCRISAAMFGLPALVIPFLTCNQLPRVAFATNHIRHSMGVPDLNWPFLYTSEYFYQPSNEYPLARTIAYDLVSPGGMNIGVMIGAFSGKNQEDSVVVNAGSIQRGRFPGIFFTNKMVEFEFSDKIGKPDPTMCDMSPHINYETIGDNGIPLIGTEIHKGDALIGRYVEKSTVAQGERKYIDRTVTYTKDETAYVVAVFPTDLKYPARNQDGKRIVRVKLALIRETVVGDKFSSRAGQKGICCSIVPDSEMPFTSQGVKPDIIINPHSQPTRMTIGQMVESCVAKICAVLGITVDCTAFKEVDPEDIRAALKVLNLNPDGTDQFYNPHNGRKMHTEMYFGPVFYQRIEKFWSDSFRAVSGGSVDLISRHISDNGDNRGLRIGEMEKDCLMSLSMPNLWGEKAYDHSHGFPTHYCRRCEQPAIVNYGNQVTDAFFKCTQCKDQAEVVKIPSSWSSKGLRQTMNICNTGMKLKVTPFEFDQHIKRAYHHDDDDVKNELSDVDDDMEDIEDSEDSGDEGIDDDASADENLQGFGDEEDEVDIIAIDTDADDGDDEPDNTE
jgi:DNA-directed RNA polymerase II subunit RPB2